MTGSKRQSTTGRPTKYHKSLCMAVKAMLSNRKMTDKAIAKELGVHKSVICDWKNRHAGFARSFIEGREAFSVDVVETDLLKQCVTHKAKKVHYTYDADLDKMVKSGMTVEDVPGNLGSQKFYLTNRRSDRWKNNIKVEATGSVMPEIHLNIGPNPFKDEVDPRLAKDEGGNDVGNP